MKFTGKNLELVRTALDMALSDIHNGIATCPDVNEYADDLDVLEIEREKIEKLIKRIDNKKP